MITVVAETEGKRRTWKLLAESREVAALWAGILNEELNRVAGSSANGSAPIRSDSAAEAANLQAPYSALTASMFAKFSPEQRVSLLESVKRGKITVR